MTATARSEAALRRLHDLAARLCLPHAWPEPDCTPDVVQTHISVILIGRDRVLKLKKPVNFGFLDYSTLERRHAACQAELRLNRRLCEPVYLGVMAVMPDHASGVRLIPASAAGFGALEYGVWMRRLPHSGMLDRMLLSASAGDRHMRQIAERLGDFHQRGDHGPAIRQWAVPAVIAANWDENFRQIAPFAGRSIGVESLGQLEWWISHWLREHRELLQRRVDEAWIVDGHGDVRAESICFEGQQVWIFDCIEFNERFRCNDVASETAFLAMDLDARGRPDLGYWFTQCYASQFANSDPGFWAVLPFYRCYRAFVRGKVASFILDQPGFEGPERCRALHLARAYFDLAARYSHPLHRPTLIAVGGLSGAGKTTVARSIAAELGLCVISTDEVRRLILGPYTRPAEFGAGPYSPESIATVYGEVFRLAAERLRRNEPVVVDATFQNSQHRAQARELAARNSAEWRFVECRLSPDQVRERMELRGRSGDGFSDATFDIYQRQAELAPPGSLEPGAPETLSLDTRAGIAVNARRVTDWLRSLD